MDKFERSTHKPENDSPTDATATVSDASLSAYERWELPNIEDNDRDAGSSVFGDKPRVVVSPEATDIPKEEDIKPLTAQDLEEIRAAAYEAGHAEGRDQGYQDGHEKGYQEAFAKGEEDLKATFARLGQISRALLDPVPRHDRELEETLLTLVENIAKRIVQRELVIDSSRIIDVVREALDCLNPAAERIRIHLNPDDTDLVINALKQSGDWQDSWRFLAHDTISPGGCIIDTDNAIVDSRAEKRLATVIRQVYEKDERALMDDDDDTTGIEQLLGEIDAFGSADDSADDCTDDVNPSSE